MFEMGKALSFFLSILSLYPIVGCAFFVPGARWKERLLLSLMKIVVAGCICFASGLFFCPPSAAGNTLTDRLLRTLPVRMFFWTLAGVAVFFLLSLCIEQYYLPLLWRNQPH